MMLFKRHLCKLINTVIWIIRECWYHIIHLHFIYFRLIWSMNIKNGNICTPTKGVSVLWTTTMWTACLSLWSSDPRVAPAVVALCVCACTLLRHRTDCGSSWSTWPWKCYVKSVQLENWSFSGNTGAGRTTINQLLCVLSNISFFYKGCVTPTFLIRGTIKVYSISSMLNTLPCLF